MHDTRSTCLYYQWILGSDHPDPDETVSIPPSEHLAGVWARTDRERGVWRSPANQVIRGVLGTTVELTANECYVLAPIGINPVLLLGRDGIRIWGSKTLSSDGFFTILELSRITSALLRACRSGLR